MGGSYSEFRHNYYNQMYRRIDRNKRNHYYRMQENSFQKSNYYYHEPNYYPINKFHSEVNNESLLLEDILYTQNEYPSFDTNFGYEPFSYGMPMAQTRTKSNYFSKIQIRPFNKNQIINQIRVKSGVFKDTYFPPQLKVMGGANSKFMNDFKQKSQMKWERTKIISYHKG